MSLLGALSLEQSLEFCFQTQLPSTEAIFSNQKDEKVSQPLFKNSDAYQGFPDPHLRTQIENIFTEGINSRTNT